MKKSLKNIIFLLIVAVVFNYKIVVYADEKVCEIEDSSQASAVLGGGYVGSSIDFYIKLYNNGVDTGSYIFDRTTGYYYTASFGDKPAFCIDSGRRRGVNYVRRGVLDKNQYRAIYEIYNWYIRNTGVSNARKIAQVLVWLSIDRPGDMNNIFSLTDIYGKTVNDVTNKTEIKFTDDAVGFQADSLVYSLADMFGAVDDCVYLQPQVRRAYPWFSCSIREYRDFTSYCVSLGHARTYCEAAQKLNIKGPFDETYAKLCSDPTSRTISPNFQQYCDLLNDYAESQARAGRDRYAISDALDHYYFLKKKTTGEYTEWLFSNAANGDIGTAMTGFNFDDAVEMLENMVNTAPYSGNLYLWCEESDTAVRVDQKYQRTYQCFVAPDSTCTSCPTELTELKKNYNFDSMSDAQKENLKNNERWKNALDTLHNTYGYTNLKDYTNPSCSGGSGGNPGGGPPICRPKFEEYACDYRRESGGFYISDSVDANGSYSEACYIANNIAFNTDSGLKEESKDADLSSKYCDVYCWEAFGADFPIGVKNIRAGSTFFWGKDKENGIFGNLNARRFCKTINIDYVRYASDWANNEDQIAQAYVDFKAQEAFNIDNGYSSGRCTLPNKGCISGHNVSGCPSGYALKGGTCYNYALTDPTCSSHNGSPGYVPGDGMACIIATTSPSSTFVCDSCPGGYHPSGGSCAPNDQGYNYTRAGKTYSHNGKTGAVGSKTTTCYESSQTAATIDAALDDMGRQNSLLSTLNAHIDDRKKIAADINACQSQSYVNKNNIYKFISTVTLNYSDPLGIDRDIDDPVELEKVSVSNGLDSTGTLNAAQNITVGCNTTPGINDASGKCTGAGYNYTIPRYDEYHWDYWGVYNFKYNQDNFAWKVIVETKEVLNYKTANGNIPTDRVVPYDVGYGIPTGFKLSTGYYDISVDVKNFGHNGHFNDLMQEKLNVDVYNYACPYQVENKVYYDECNYECDDNTKTCKLIYNSPADCPGINSSGPDSGIDLVYRLIEMPNKPAGVANIGTRRNIVFPSIDGDGRAPGENWATFINNEPKGFVNITTNALIYDEEGTVNKYGPIYEIELTPTAINAIRTDTLTYRNEGKDPYTSYTNAYGHGKVICEGDTPKERTCASNYITELIQSNVITGGYYAECTQCTNTGGRLDWIDSQKERFYE